jgi:hypothetical protein
MATGWRPARRNRRVSGSCSFRNARRSPEDHAVHVPAVAGAVEGAAPASSGSATRIRARSASACGRRARRGARGHADLPARTGAVQVDVGVAGAVRVPARGAVGAATPAWVANSSAHPEARCATAPAGDLNACPAGTYRVSAVTSPQTAPPDVPAILMSPRTSIRSLINFSRNHDDGERQAGRIRAGQTARFS